MRNTETDTNISLFCVRLALHLPKVVLHLLTVTQPGMRYEKLGQVLRVRVKSCQQQVKAAR